MISGVHAAGRRRAFPGPLRIACLGILWLLTPATGAGTTAGNGQAVWREAIERHPRWLESVATVNEAKARLGLSWSNLSPQLELRRTLWDLPGESSVSREWDLSLPLDGLLELGARRKALHAELAVAEAQALQVRRELSQELGSIWWETLGSIEMLKAQGEILGQQRQLCAAVNARVRSGVERPLEAERSNLELASARLDSLDAARAAKLCAQRLLQWKLDVPQDASGLYELESLRDQVARPWRPEADPEVQAAKAMTEAALAELRSARLGWSQGLGLTLGQELDNSGTGRVVGLGWSLPVDAVLGSGRAEAQAKVRACRAREEGLMRSLELLHEERAAQAVQSVEVALSIQHELMPASVRISNALDVAWKVGEASLFEVLEARRRVAELRRDGARAAVQAQVDALRWQVLQGEE